MILYGTFSTLMVDFSYSSRNRVNMFYLTNSNIVFDRKMEPVFEITIFGKKMIM